MNERIQKLAEQQGLTGPNYFLSSQELEKFALLIVGECAAVSRKSSKRIDDMGSLIAQDIEKHFGVEE